MIRNLKLLGLAAVAMLAFGSMAASAASATEFTFTAGAYPAHLTGGQVAAEPSKFETAAGVVVTCGTVHFDGVGTISAGTHDVTVTPTYSNCHAKVGASTLPATVTHNECVYTFTTGNLITTHEGEGIVHLVCGASPIEIHIYANTTKHAEGVTLCTLTVASQTISGIKYIYDTTEEVVTAKTTPGVSTISYTRDGSILCGASGNLEYLGNTAVEALNEEGTKVSSTFD